MTTLMPWLDRLTDADGTDFPARRDRIAALVQRAAAPSADSATLLAEVNVEVCMLEGDAKAHWSITVITTGRGRRTAFDPSVFRSGPLELRRAPRPNLTVLQRELH